MDQGSDTRAGRVLLADDEPVLRHALARALRSAGHEVVEAGTGAEAAKLFGASAFDVVVSDIQMPDMNGIELLKLVHERQPDVPVLLMTGTPDLETAMRAVEYGAFEYLTKPVDLTKLETSVLSAMKRYRAASEQRRLASSVEREKGSIVATGHTPPVEPGTMLAGKYRLGRCIGAGGMGTVYEAVREDLAHMRVAVKVLHPMLAARAELIARFRREAEVVASINHPNIVKILDFAAPEGGAPFLVMELLDGNTLAAAIEKSEPFSQERTAFITTQVLSALAAAHDCGAIHRDLKPENIFLTTISGIPDVVKLLDFGIAKLMGESDQKLTQTGTVLGTPAYMAPEYARGEAPSVRGDIYALGCVMYEALSKRPPFAGGNYNALLFAIQQSDPKPLSELRPDISAELAAVVTRALAKDPEARFHSAREMESALEPWVIRKSSRRVSDRPLESAPTLLAAPNTSARSPK